jgi:Helix-turn-helix domain
MKLKGLIYLIAVILTYRYRLLPLKSQHRALERLCGMQRELYNAALEERIDCYRNTGKTRTYIDQCKALTQCRHELTDMGELPVNLQRWTLKRRWPIRMLAQRPNARRLLMPARLPRGECGRRCA